MILNSLVLIFYRLLRMLHRIRHREYPQNLSINEAALGSHQKEIEQDHGMFERQYAYTDMRYGTQMVSFCACEVIATYNALRILEAGSCEPRRFIDLLSHYEHDGIAWGGFFGTAPQAIADYFRTAGYVTDLVYRERDYDLCGAAHEVMILTMYNNRKRIQDMIHTVCITKDDAGRFTMHNAGMEKKSFASVSELLASYNDGKAGGILLIGVNRLDVIDS